MYIYYVYVYIYIYTHYVYIYIYILLPDLGGEPPKVCNCTTARVPVSPTCALNNNIHAQDTHPWYHV